MELERARSRSSTERGQVQQLLAEIGKARTDDHEAKPDATYPAQPLAQQGVEDAVGPARGARSGTPADRRRQLRSLDPSCLLLRQLSLAPKLFWLEPGIAVNRAWRILLHWRLLRPGDLRYEGLTNQSPRKREQPGAVPLGRAFPLTSPDGQ
jgi:hypothetical protein